MKNTKKLIFLAVSLFFLYGCELALIGLGAGGGIAGYKYIEGHTTKDFPLEYSMAWDSTNTALENLNISISSSEDEGTKGEIKGLRKDGKDVTINLKKRGEWVTTISARVGAVGNRDKAEKVLNEIAAVAGIQ